MARTSSSSRSQQMVVQSSAETGEDTREQEGQVNSSLDEVLLDDDEETVRDYPDTGHSYAGIIARAVLRGGSE